MLLHGSSMKTPKPQKKVVVKLYGHEWAVYPIKSRDSTIFRVFHRGNGERVPKTFMSLAKASEFLSLGSLFIKRRVNAV